MLLSIDSAVSALDEFQQQLNVIGNNIANVNTVGFKSATVNFEDTLSQTIGSNSIGSEQVGTGVSIADINNQFTQGSISATNVPSNLAINGTGFFVVKDPVSGAEYATRDGDFAVNSSGDLVTSNGMLVQGYSDSGLTTMGNIQISNANAPGGDTSPVSSYTFSNTGTLNITLADGTSFTGGQVLLQNFTDPNQLVSAGNNLFSNLANAGPLAAPVAPSQTGPGLLSPGSLEMSNVDLADELTSLITTQSAYAANSKVITTSDNILQTLTNLVR
jgi:flagellar hook protein FlgE